VLKKVSLNKIFILGCLFIIFGLPKNSYGQEDSTVIIQDSVIVVTEINKEDSIVLDESRRFVPKKAALYSAVMPGLGQVYNKKYWKVPLFYGAAGAFIFFAIQNNQDYLSFRESYLAKTDASTPRFDPFPTFSSEAVRVNRNAARRNRDFMIILASLVYALQIADASVDAHLKTFDVSDELTFDFKPQWETLMMQENLIGVSLKIYIR